MRQEYEINASTLAIIAVDDNTSKVIEKEDVFYVQDSAINIIDISCKYFGSTYNGRFEATKSLLGFCYKLPIIVEESRNMIFFPTTSPRVNGCIWIALNHILEFRKNNDKSYIIFSNGFNMDLDVSYGTIENEILRATRLDSLISKRKVEC